MLFLNCDKEFLFNEVNNDQEILRGVYPECGRKRFFALLRMASEGLRMTSEVLRHTPTKRRDDNLKLPACHSEGVLLFVQHKLRDRRISFFATLR